MPRSTRSMAKTWQKRSSVEQPTYFSHMAQRAKRVSYSTSHSETLAAISGLETATLVSLRLAELLMPEKKPTLQQLAALQEKGIPYLSNRLLHRLQRLLVIDSWYNSTSSRSKSTNLHPSLQRGENPRKSSMDHFDPNRIYDLRRLDKGHDIKTFAGTDDDRNRLLPQQDWSCNRSTTPSDDH